MFPKPERRPQRFLLIALLLAALAYADPYDTSSHMRGNYGYLVLDTIIKRPVSQLRLDAGFTVETLPLGRQTILLRLRSGSYHWQDLNVPYFDLPHRLDVSDDRRWGFRIERQKINYAGTLLVGEQRASNSVDVRFINRLSEIPAIVADAYPEVSASYELVYTGWFEDDYLQLMAEDRASGN